MDLEEQNNGEKLSSKRHCVRSDEEKGKHEKMDSSYFKSYEDIGIHEEMIRDTVRTNSYRLAILRASGKLIGKVAADVGAGTGVLSCFCVQAGAKKVYAIEASTMAEQARKVAKVNAGQKIEVIQELVEDVELPEKVDVIVSEWMGHFLLYESMLNSVIHARDKWLAKDGIVLPNKANLYLAPITNEDIYSERVEFWSHVKEKFGVDMACLEPCARRALCGPINVEEVDRVCLLAKECHIKEIDIHTVTTDEIQCVKQISIIIAMIGILMQYGYQSPFKFQCFGMETFCGFTSWFTVTFDAETGGKAPIVISTSPEAPMTHWRQSTMYLEHPIKVEQDTVISGTITLTPGRENTRYLDVEITFQVDDQEPITNLYSLTDGYDKDSR